MREKRPVIAVDIETGTKKEYDSAYACAKELRVNPTNVLSAALINGGVCKGYRIYDTPETIRKRINELENLLEELS